MNVFERVVELVARCQNVVVESALPHRSAKPSLFPDPLVRRNFDAHQNIGNRCEFVGQQDSVPVIRQEAVSRHFETHFLSRRSECFGENVKLAIRERANISPKIARDEEKAGMQFQAV